MANQPIMSPDEERYMAFMGLIQWTQAVVRQAERIQEALTRQRESYGIQEIAVHQYPILAPHVECHFFSIAAYKLIEHRNWIIKFGLCAGVDFSEMDRFPAQDMRDLRNMREHVVEYFQGDGRAKNRWTVETPEYSADASSMAGTMIGGRLDWVEFSAMAKQLLPALLAQPVPYPSTDVEAV